MTINRQRKRLFRNRNQSFLRCGRFQLIQRRVGGSKDCETLIRGLCEVLLQSGFSAFTRPLSLALRPSATVVPVTVVFAETL
jgi:hypothetical protein